MDIFLCIVYGSLILSLVWNLFLYVRYDIVYKNQLKIIDAAYDYATDTKQYEMFNRIVNAMESTEQTAKRWRDWGYKNILPNVYYEMIAPYIR